MVSLGTSWTSAFPCDILSAQGGHLSWLVGGWGLQLDWGWSRVLAYQDQDHKNGRLTHFFLPSMNMSTIFNIATEWISAENLCSVGA